MAIVEFERSGLVAQVPVGSSILDAARLVGAPEGSRCGGVCACRTCHVYVLAGADLLAPPTTTEAELIRRAQDPQSTSRLGCQAVLEADGLVRVRITDESFQEYLDKNPDDAERALAVWLRDG